MASDSEDLLLQLSAALASATASAQSSVVAIRAPRSPPLSGTLWRDDLVVASDQVFPRADSRDSADRRCGDTRPCRRARSGHQYCRLATRVADRVRSFR